MNNEAHAALVASHGGRRVMRKEEGLAGGAGGTPARQTSGHMQKVTVERLNFTKRSKMREAVYE